MGPSQTSMVGASSTTVSACTISGLRCGEHFLAGNPGIEATGAPGAEEGAERHLGSGALVRTGAPTNFPTGDQMAQAALRRIVIGGHLRLGHEDEQLLDIAQQ